MLLVQRQVQRLNHEGAPGVELVVASVHWLSTYDYATLTIEYFNRIVRCKSWSDIELALCCSISAPEIKIAETMLSLRNSLELAVWRYGQCVPPISSMPGDRIADSMIPREVVDFVTPEPDSPLRSPPPKRRRVDRSPSPSLQN
jgi:hypothetical protein